MPTLKANTLTRVDVSELGGVTIDGGPATAALSFLSDGSTSEWDTSQPLTAKACPDRIEVSWEVSGVTVSAAIDLVAAQYCTLDDVRAYRETAYQLADATAEAVEGARAKATEVIERECHRFFVPVLREAIVERTNCSAARYPIVMDGYPHDLRRVASCEYVDGGEAVASLSSDETLDVSAMEFHRPARAVLELGCAHAPSEVRDAVVALAAWYLMPNAGPDNAISESVDSGVLRYVVGGVGGAATSLPAVNAAIGRYGAREWFVR